MKFQVDSFDSSASDSMSSDDSGDYESSYESDYEPKPARPSSFFKPRLHNSTESEDVSQDNSFVLDLSNKMPARHHYHPWLIPTKKSIIRRAWPTSMQPAPASHWNPEILTEYSDDENEMCSDRNTNLSVFEDFFTRSRGNRDDGDEMRSDLNATSSGFEDFDPSQSSTPAQMEWNRDIEESPKNKLIRMRSFYSKPPPQEFRALKRKLEDNQENQPLKKMKSEPLIKAARLFAVPKQRILTPQKQKFCEFCKRNGEHPMIYNHHTLKDVKGRVLCPTLRQKECSLCHADGDNAHEIQDCPKQPQSRQNCGFNLGTPTVSFIGRNLGVMRI